MYFSSCLQSCSIGARGAKDADVGGFLVESTCAKGICARSICMRDTCPMDACVRIVFISDACSEGTCAGIVERLRIYLQSFQILKVKLFDMG